MHPKPQIQYLECDTIRYALRDTDLTGVWTIIWASFVLFSSIAARIGVDLLQI